MAKQKFYFHPDRDKEVGDAIMRGKLTAYPHQLVASNLMPLDDPEGKPILGWWINEMEPCDWMIYPEVPKPIFEYGDALLSWAQSISGGGY